MNRLLIIFIIVSFFLLSGCTQRQDITGAAVSEQQYQELNNFSDYSDELIIGNFNIQVFGKTKAGKEQVMQIIENIIEPYDLISIQEIRDKSGEAFQSLMASLPAHQYVISDRLGRSSSKEQYAYIYNPRKLTHVNSYVYEEAEDVFEREPFIAKFASGNTNFVIIQIHTKPTDAESEIANLEYVLTDARENFPGETEFIIIGDLNADCSYYKADELAELEWIIPAEADTTTGNSDCAYDRIIVTEELADNVLGYGIDKFDLTYELNESDTKAVSDHYPVFAVLDIE